MTNNKIIFRDSDHSYWFDNERLIGVNTLLKDYGFYFDTDFWLVWKGFQLVIPNFYKKYFGAGFNFDNRIPDYKKLYDKFKKLTDLELEELVAPIQEDWNESSRLGTEFHTLMEDNAYKNGYIINPYDNKKYPIHPRRVAPEGYDNQSTEEYLRNLKDGSYAELLIFLTDYGICGLGDEIFIETIGGVRYLDVGDHKTNKKAPSNQKGDELKYPLHNFKGNNLIKYQAQTSLYGKMLSKYGYVVRNVGFYHYKNYDESTKKVYKLKYLEDECNEILDLRYSNYQENIKKNKK